MPRFLWMLPTVQQSEREGALLLQQSDGRTLMIKGLGERASKLLRSLDGNITEEHASTLPLGRALIELLDREKLLVRLSRPLRETADANPRRTRQLSYYAHLTQTLPDLVLRDLQARSVLIMGLGGIGSHAALCLAGAGVGRLVLCDPDVVEASNLNRQILFTDRDLGAAKVIVIQRELRLRHPEVAVEIDTSPEEQHAEALAGVIATLDLVVICSETALFFKQPHLADQVGLLTAGYQGATGVVGPLLSRRHGSPCWACILRFHERSIQERIEESVVPRVSGWNSSGAALNAVVGGMVAETAVRFLAPGLGDPLLLGERLYFDMTSMHVRKSAIPPPPCPHRYPTGLRS